jgi:hypothetical protein
MTANDLFALFLVVTVLLLVLRCTPWSSRFHFWPTVAFFVLLTVFTGYFAWRDHEAVGQLKALVDLPPYNNSIYVPRGEEMRAIARLLPAAVPSNFPLTRQETEQVKTEIMSSKDLATFWIIETSSSPDSVHDFYESEHHRKGWEIAEQSRIHLVLGRQGSSLAIFFLDDFPRPDAAIVYVFRPNNRAP